MGFSQEDEQRITAAVLKCRRRFGRHVTEHALKVVERAMYRGDVRVDSVSQVVKVLEAANFMLLEIIESLTAGEECHSKKAKAEIPKRNSSRGKAAIQAEGRKKDR